MLLTRALKSEGAPTIASRFWLRLEALTGGMRRDDERASLARRIDADKSAWAVAARLQQTELSTLHRAVPNLAAGTVMALFGVPGYSAPGVPIFAAPWDLDGAVMLGWDSPTVSAYPVLAGGLSQQCRGTRYKSATAFRSSKPVDDRLPPQPPAMARKPLPVTLPVRSSTALHCRPILSKAATIAPPSLASTVASSCILAAACSCTTRS